jgi:predicted nucleic acid-binding protein
VNEPYGGRRLVVDNSAFQRGGDPAVRDEWLSALRNGQLYRSPILEFEVLCLEAQATLAAHGAAFHRVAHRDYLIAAMAAAYGLGVLHCDGDYDRIAVHSHLVFDSVWIARAGTTGGGRDPLRTHRQAVDHGLAQFSGERARTVLERVLDLIDEELRADGLQAPIRP